MPPFRINRNRRARLCRRLCCSERIAKKKGESFKFCLRCFFLHSKIGTHKFEPVFPFFDAHNQCSVPRCISFILLFALKHLYSKLTRARRGEGHPIVASGLRVNYPLSPRPPRTHSFRFDSQKMRSLVNSLANTQKNNEPAAAAAAAEARRLLPRSLSPA